MMLTIQTLVTPDVETGALYMAIPVTCGREDPDIEYMFQTEEDLSEFVDFYFINPLAAMFAYQKSRGYTDEDMLFAEKL